MNAPLRHRGPDDQGILVDESAGLALAHRRLSILDLSREGRQPMRSESGRYLVVYNGEVYNCRALRSELERKTHRFRGHSDTEVLLAAVEEWGFEDTLTRLNGMFALALWDRVQRTLSLARDRLGEKPLYYGWLNGTLVFASELKSLRAHPAFHAGIDTNALALFLRYGYIPQPWSIYRGILKLPPASMIRFRAGSQEASPRAYWSSSEVAEAGASNPFTQNGAELTRNLDLLLRDAVRLRMQSDVPLGAFLSGGVDSSTIVALMQEESTRPVRTFSIGFHEESFNEAKFAARVAQHVGSDHTEMYVTARDAMAVIPRLAHVYDEPFADSSQIPTYLVSQLARSQVTVSLSGDGGDELFGGYNRYKWAPRIWSAIRWLPLATRTSAAFLRAIAGTRWQHQLAGLKRLAPQPAPQRWDAATFLKFADWLSVTSREALYSKIISTWKSPADVVLNSAEPLTVVTDPASWAGLRNYASWMMYLDMVSYLPDDILVKLDRASMAVSLEARVPFLDHRVVEFAWRLPLQMKCNHKESKWLLRQVLYQYVPAHLVKRPKMGFAIPIGEWLKTSLREWVEDLIDPARLRTEGFLQAEPIRQLWAQHLAGERDGQRQLWNVIMFQGWLESNTSDRNCVVA